jgi:transposase-like protein
MVMSSAALAAFRKARAVELALAGYSYDQIAHELGLANRGTAWHLVQNALKERMFAAVDAYRAAELARLQRVEDALWPEAMAGRYRAGNSVLNVMDKRIRLLGLMPEATMESNRCTCECPIHGSHGSWRPTRRAQDMAERFDPPAAIVAVIEERMAVWVDEIGVWAVFEVMTMIAQVMEMVARAEEADGVA